MAGIAILGAGIFAIEYHLPALHKLGADLKAVYSRSTTSAQKIKDAAVKLGYPATSIEVYSDQADAPGGDASKLLARNDIGAVSIILPIPSQPDLIRRALAAGKHVLSEKPLAPDVATGRALVQAYIAEYEPKGLVWSVAENHRFIADLEQARRWVVDEGRIGALTQVYFSSLSALPTDAKFLKDSAWRQKPAYQGGFVLDGGVHNVAGLRWVTGQEIVETRGFGANFAPHMPPLDTVVSALRFSGGAVGTIVMSWASSREQSEASYIGTEGSVVVTPGGKVQLLGKDQKVIEEKVLENKSIAGENEAFLRAIKDGKAQQRASAVEAFNDLAAIESIIQGGGKVQLWTG